MDLCCPALNLSCTAGAVAFVAVVTFFVITALITGITLLSNAVTVAAQVSYDYGVVSLAVIESGDASNVLSVTLINGDYTPVHMPTALSGGGSTTNSSKFNVTTTGPLQGIIVYTPSAPIASPSTHGIRGVITFNINLASSIPARAQIYYGPALALGSDPPSLGGLLNLMTMAANLQPLPVGTDFELSCPFRIDLDDPFFAGQELTLFPMIRVVSSAGVLTVLTLRCYTINTLVEEVPRLVKYVGP